MSPTFAALGARNFRLFAAGQLVSSTGTWMQRVAQDWLVLQLSGGSGMALGVVVGLQFLPMLLLSLLGGVLADRLPKRELLLATQALMGLQALLLGVLVVSGQAQLWHVYALALLLGVASALDAPARQSFVVEMVGRDHLSNAVALNSATFNLGRVVGPALAGLLIAALGTGPVFLINAVSYLAVIAGLLLMRGADLYRPETRTGDRGGVRIALRYVRARPDLVLVLMLVGIVGTFGFNMQVTTALMATDVFGLSALGFGVLSALFAVGSLAGALLAARRSGMRQDRPSVRLVVALGAGFGLLMMLSAAAPVAWAFGALLLPTGICAIGFATLANANVQLGSDGWVRGRVMALYLLVFFGGNPLGSPLVGALASTLGPRGALAATGLLVVLLVMAAAAWVSRRAGPPATASPAVGTRPTAQLTSGRSGPR
jgi:MFS family permease